MIEQQIELQKFEIRNNRVQSFIEAKKLNKKPLGWEAHDSKQYKGFDFVKHKQYAYLKE